MSQTVQFAIVDGVATITLNRPERLNALDTEMHAGLREALSSVEADPTVRAVILTGSGRAFCAGQDLAERAATFAEGRVPDLGASLALNYNPLVRRLIALPCPVIAAVNGVAFGAGAALAIACDLVVGSSSAKFQFGFVRVALGPDAGTSWLLPRRVGPGRALAWALTGKTILSEEALQSGLCDRIVEESLVIKEATLIARQFADGPDEAIRATKRALRLNVPRDLEEALEAEHLSQSALGDHWHYREAVTAFTMKRIPSFGNSSTK